ncbi:hypothetical protein IV102_31010 [bacterium]|nr:hypothetical protein [bacterium]
MIQRSLWCQADPTWNKERLQQDLEEQVKSSGGQQTPEQVQQGRGGRAPSLCKRPQVSSIFAAWVACG